MLSGRRDKKYCDVGCKDAYWNARRSDRGRAEMRDASRVIEGTGSVIDIVTGLPQTDSETAGGSRRATSAAVNEVVRELGEIRIGLLTEDVVDLDAYLRLETKVAELVRAVRTALGDDP
jgi:hypothetical protein